METVTYSTEKLKEDIIEFIMRNNEILYSKRLAGFEDVTRKADLLAYVAQLKI